MQFDAIGTHWQITTSQPIPKAVQQLVLERIEQYDRNYSRFRSDSLVSTMATTAGTYELPEDARPLLDLYRQLYDVSHGKVTPLIGQVLSDAGYDAAYSLTPGELVAPPAWDDVLEYTGSSLILKRPALLDFGAAGKGYLVDIIGELLEASSITDYCVNAGGDLRVHGRTERVGLEHPADVSQAIGIATVSSGSLCGSSGNRRAWAGFHHTIDPDQLQSPTSLQASWVTASSALLADGLTTALYFVPANQLQAIGPFEYALIRQDFSLEHSAKFPAEFF